MKHAVVIAGGGPTGLMLAGELALANVDVAVVERRSSQDLDGLRAGGLHMRTIEIFDQRGIADRFLAEGQVARITPFAAGSLDASDLPTRHSYYLALWQTHVERILAEWVSERQVPFYRGLMVTDFTQHAAGVEVELSNGRMVSAEYLVGCDGGRSVVRKRAGIDFSGWSASTSYLIAEVETAEEPAWGLRRGEKGINAFAKLPGGDKARVVLSEQQLVKGDEPTLQDVRDALTAVYGTDYGLRKAEYISRFTDMTRQAACYRDRRVLLAGDAAHVHSPVGGQGLNISVQDAVNLGWKLAQVIHGTSPETLLDTYHAERHPVGARVLRNTMALSAMERSDDRVQALRDMMTELMQNRESRRHYVAMMAGLDIRYDCGDGHPLLGRRMPDLEVQIHSGALRVFTLLHEARPVLLNLGEPIGTEFMPWANRVKLVNASYDGAWKLPALGAVDAPTAVLIRPDGYVAWVRGSRPLAEALTHWFGAPAAG
jgi:3-(3-hydroxy-phenyl)propionate hydroxylase